MGVSIRPGRWPLAAAGLVAVLVVIATAPRDEEAPGTAPVADGAPTAAAAMHATPSAARPAASASREGPRDPARIFELGLAGDLVIDIDTQAALDTTLAELGTAPSPAELQRLESGLRSGLPAAAADEAIALFRRYLAYSRDYARAIETQPPADTPEQVRAMLDRTEALQRQHFGEAHARALFGLQMAHSRHQLDVQAVLDDPRLSPADKAARVQALRERLPAEVRELDTAPVPSAEPAPAGASAPA